MSFVFYLLFSVLFVLFAYAFVTEGSDDFIEAWIGMWFTLGLLMIAIAIKDRYHYKWVWQYIPLTTNGWTAIVALVAVVVLTYKVGTLAD